MKRKSPWLIAAAATLSCPPVLGTTLRSPPVSVHIDAIGDHCIYTADGQPFDPARPLRLPLRQQMRGHGVRLTYANPNTPYRCIRDTVSSLLRQGIAVTVVHVLAAPPATDAP
jgi:hypothetical protein